MLSRTADSLYWLARYMERAENIARIVMVGHRMSSLTRSLENSGNEWHSTLLAAGCEPEFFKKHAEASPALVIDYLVRDPDNPSSIFSCLETARRNARAVRTALTVDMWDALNETWHQARGGKRFLYWEKLLTRDSGSIMRGLRAVSAIFRTAAGLNAKQHRALNFARAVVVAVDKLRLKDQLQ